MFVQHLPFQLCLLRSEFQLDQLHQNDGEEDARTKRRTPECGKIKADGDESGFNVSTSSSSVNIPIVSKRPGILKASTGKPDVRRRSNSKPDAASFSLGRLQDAYLGGLMAKVVEKPVATDKRQESWDTPESESWNNHESEVTVNLVASRNSENSRSSEAESKIWPQHFHTSHHQQAYLTWRKSIRSYDKFTV